MQCLYNITVQRVPAACVALEKW